MIKKIILALFFSFSASNASSPPHKTVLNLLKNAEIEEPALRPQVNRILSLLQHAQDSKDSPPKLFPESIVRNQSKLLNLLVVPKIEIFHVKKLFHTEITRLDKFPTARSPLAVRRNFLSFIRQTPGTFENWKKKWDEEFSKHIHKSLRQKKSNIFATQTIQYEDEHFRIISLLHSLGCPPFLSEQTNIEEILNQAKQYCFANTDPATQLIIPWLYDYLLCHITAFQWRHLRQVDHDKLSRILSLIFSNLSFLPCYLNQKDKKLPESLYNLMNGTLYLYSYASRTSQSTLKKDAEYAMYFVNDIYQLAETGQSISLFLNDATNLLKYMLHDPAIEITLPCEETLQYFECYTPRDYIQGAFIKALNELSRSFRSNNLINIPEYKILIEILMQVIINQINDHDNLLTIFGNIHNLQQLAHFDPAEGGLHWFCKNAFETILLDDLAQLYSLILEQKTDFMTHLQQIVSNSSGELSELLEKIGREITESLLSRKCTASEYSGMVRALHLLIPRIGKKQLGHEHYNYEKRSPLHRAVIQENYIEVSKLLGENGNIDCPDIPHGMTPLFHAIYNPTLCQKLLSEGANPNVRDSAGNTALHYALLHNAPSETILLLLASGIRVNEQNNQKDTPLHYAMYRDTRIIRTLLEYGADPTIENTNHETPSSLAERHQPSITKLLQESGQLKIPPISTTHIIQLHTAVQRGHTAVVQRLLENGVPENIPDSRGFIPLHFAARLPSADIAKLLLSKKSETFHPDVTCKSKNGNTPLHVAAEYGQIAVAKLLLERGASLTEANNAGQTPRDIAREWQRDEFLFFLQNFADQKKESAQSTDDTPLHSEMWKKHSWQKAAVLDEYMHLIEKGTIHSSMTVPFLRSLLENLRMLTDALPPAQQAIKIYKTFFETCNLSSTTYLPSPLTFALFIYEQTKYYSPLKKVQLLLFSEEEKIKSDATISRDAIISDLYDHIIKDEDLTRLASTNNETPWHHYQKDTRCLHPQVTLFQIRVPFQQDGTTCGYHAVLNGIHLAAALLNKMPWEQVTLSDDIDSLCNATGDWRFLIKQVRLEKIFFEFLKRNMELYLKEPENKTEKTALIKKIYRSLLYTAIAAAAKKWVDESTVTRESLLEILHEIKVRRYEELTEEEQVSLENHTQLNEFFDPPSFSYPFSEEIIKKALDEYNYHSQRASEGLRPSPLDLSGDWLNEHELTLILNSYKEFFQSFVHTTDIAISYEIIDQMDAWIALKQYKETKAQLAKTPNTVRIFIVGNMSQSHRIGHYITIVLYKNDNDYKYFVADSKGSNQLYNPITIQLVKKLL